MCLAHWDVFLVSVVVMKHWVIVSHPEWRAVGGPIRKPVTTDRGKFLSSYECFISQASGCVQVKIFTPHHKTKPTYMCLDWSRHDGPTGHELLWVLMWRNETSVHNVSDNIKLFKALKSLGSGPVCGFLQPRANSWKRAPTVWNNLRWGKNPFSSALWFFLL